MAICLNEFLTCPDCPTALPLADLPVNYTCFDLPIQSEIQWIFFVPVDATGVPLAGANPFTSWATVPTITVGAVDNSDPLKTHVIQVVGNLDAPTKQVAIQPGFKSTTFKRTYAPSLEVTSLGDLTYEFMKTLQCGRTDGYKIFYGITGGYVFGDVTGNGICLREIDVDFVYARGEESFVSATILPKWSADGEAVRRTNPYA
jgi:hypothetical protein